MTLVTFQIGLESLGSCPSASDCRLPPTEVISSVPSAQPGFVNASCPCALPACLFCFRQSIKEQNSAHNCLCMGFPGTQHLWQVCFGDYRFWHRLGALLECQSRVRGEDVTEMMSICRRRGIKKELVEGKALGNYRFWIPDKGKPTTGSEPSVFWNIYAIICSKDSG